jgi:cytochrome c551/c552
MEPRFCLILLIVFPALISMLPALSVQAQSSTIRDESTANLFANSVAPVLVSRCLACHNEDKSEGGYSLSSIAKLFSGGDSEQPAITAGELGKSELWQRLIATDKSFRMPSEGEPLNPVELKAIEAWIASGARISDAYREKSLAEIAVMRRVHAPPVYPRPMAIHALRIGKLPNDIFVGGYAEVTRWNASTQSLVQRIDVAGEHVASFDLSSDGKWMAVSSGTPGLSGIVEIVNLEAVNGMKMALPPTQDISPSVAFSPDGRRLAIAGFDGTLRVISIHEETGMPTIEYALTPHADTILSVEWSSDGKRLLTGSRDRTAKLFDATRMELLVSYDRHERAVGGIGIFDKRPLTLDETGRLRVMQGDDEDRVVSEQAGLPRVLQEFSSNQEGIYIADKHRVRSFEIETIQVDDGKDKDDKPKTKQVTRIKERPSLDAKTGSDLISVTATSAVIAAGSQQGEVWIWDRESRSVIASFLTKP